MRFDAGRLMDFLYAFERMKGYFSMDDHKIRKHLIRLLPIDSYLIILYHKFGWGGLRNFSFCLLGL